DILKQCGVAKSNFYYHFRSKEELAFAVLEAQIADFEALVTRSLRNSALTPSERIARFFDQICQAQVKVQKMAGCPFGNFAASLPSADDDERNARFRKRLCQLFQ